MNDTTLKLITDENKLKQKTDEHKRLFYDDDNDDDDDDDDAAVKCIARN